MPLLLKAVPAARGAQWVRDGLRLYARRPLAFSLQMAAFLFVDICVSIIPYIGLLLQLMLLPLLSLGFMVSSHAALRGEPVRPAQFVEPLLGDAKQRRALLLLCAGYGLAMLALLALCNAMSDGALLRLSGSGGSMSAAELQALRTSPGLGAALLLLALLASLLALPFWHAPALVHWGAQGAAQALFSSTLAVWRARGAFAVYMLVFSAAVLVYSLVSALFFALVGASQLALALTLPAGLFFSTLFYVSLLFTFNDSFGGADG